MKWTSALAIYTLFWTLCLFIVLPFGVRTAEEAGAERLPGHADSAPHGFSLGRTALRTTIISAILFGAYYLNYVNGWITAETLDWAH
jgi:predicted secreted protein